MSAALPGGLLGTYLSDPLAFWQHTARLLLPAAPAAAVLAAGWHTARHLLHRRRQERLTAGGTAWTVLLPPAVEAAAAEAFWSHLTGLLRPWYRRLTTGQPHLAFEYRFTSTGLAVRLWAPGCVPQALLRRAVEAAWPGAHTRIEQPSAGPAKGAQYCTGGELRLTRPEILPLRTAHDADPLRALLGAGAALPAGAEAVVSVLARPATGRRVHRAKHALRRLRAAPEAPPGQARSSTSSPTGRPAPPPPPAIPSRAASCAPPWPRLRVRNGRPRSGTPSASRPVRAVKTPRGPGRADAPMPSPWPSPSTRAATSMPATAFAVPPNALPPGASRSAGTCCPSPSSRTSPTCRSMPRPPASSGPGRARSSRRLQSPGQGRTPNRSVPPTPGPPGPSPSPSRTAATTCTSSAPPAPASPP
ncbi:hypothetical protein ACFQ1I_32925 [Kitasatospora arboriphila]